LTVSKLDVVRLLRLLGWQQLSLRLNTAATMDGAMAANLRIQCTFCTTTQPITNTLFGLLFEPNRIRIEYSVQP